MGSNDEIIDMKLQQIKNMCFHLTNLLPYGKIRIEYNRNKKIADCGKIDLSFHFSTFTS